jgi:hypothetical protein
MMFPMNCRIVRVMQFMITQEFFYYVLTIGKVITKKYSKETLYNQLSFLLD